MKSQSVGTRARMLISAVEIIRERGTAGATIDAILARSGAPRGSVYHHFPHGRSQIIAESVSSAGATITSIIEQASTTGDTRQVLRGFIDLWKNVLRGSEFDAGCPIVAVTVNGSAEDPALREQGAAIFGRWREILTTLLVGEGLEGPRAARLASMIVASIEGAVILCRADRSVDPLDDIGRELDALLASAL